MPTTPGVYLFKDERDRVIYVGKADNLRARVRSYFNRGGDGRQLIPLLVSAIRDLDTVVVANTKEALLLENQLIKQHQPRFNVKLKDDSNYLSIRLDTKHAWPKVDLVRKIRRDGARYFGPYDSATSVRRTLQVLNRHFQLRTCSDSVLNNRSRPCILYQIKRCPAPCLEELAPSKAEYTANVEAAALFLEGRGEELAMELDDRMRKAAEALEFEQAARLRDQIRAVQRVLVKQQVVFTHGKDEDVFGFARQDDLAQIHLLQIRNGHLRDIRRFTLNDLKLPDAEVVASFINQYYAGRDFGGADGRRTDLPHRVLVPFDLEDADAKEAWLSERAGRRVEVRRPQRGRARKLMETAHRNAQIALAEADRDESRRHDVLDRLAKRLRLKVRPEVIDCADISLFQGAEAVGSVVRFRDALPFKEGYRRFKVRTVTGTDDYAMMYEVLTRHLRRCAEAGDLPDLLVVDGGKGQLGVAKAAADDLGLDDLALASLAKSRVTSAASHTERSSGSTAAERSPERVFLPGAKDPLILRQDSAELLLLARLRDEAHRFAITYHRRRRRASTLKSALDGIPGVGPSRRKALLTAFGSVDGVKKAPEEALACVPGIGPVLAKVIKSGLR